MVSATLARHRGAGLALRPTGCTRARTSPAWLPAGYGRNKDSEVEVAFHPITIRLSMLRLFLPLVIAGALSGPVLMGHAQSPWELVVLGKAQDAGIPQLGCTQAA